MKKRLKVTKKEYENSIIEEIKFKSQAAMEYLMTYGWAILIIALTLAVLYSLGIMNPKNFLPRAPPGSCFVFRPNGPGTTNFISLQGTCGYLPMYVASFNGVTTYTGSLNSPFILSGDRTWVLWILPLRGPDPQTIYEEGTSGNGQMFYVYSNSNPGRLAVDCWNRGWYYSSYKINVNKWNQVVFVYNSTSATGKFYINGNFDTTTPAYTSPGFYNANNFYIGGNPLGASGKYYNGSIANVQIYNTALTPQEIQYLYQQGLGGGPVRLQNLVAWWPLNGDAKDYSGNNNHGTIYGGVTFVQNYNPP